VFSSRLDAVEGNARLAAGDPPEELARLEGDIAVGGAGLAATLIERGLIDEFRVFVNPVIVGGGTPFFPAVDHRIDLELVERRRSAHARRPPATAALTDTPRAGAATVDGRDSAREANATVGRPPHPRPRTSRPRGSPRWSTRSCSTSSPAIRS
jgi:hypothetical protein